MGAATSFRLPTDNSGQTRSCESETGASLTSNPFDDGCLGRSGYQFDLEGGFVNVTQTAYPGRARFGYAEVAPTGNDWLIQGIDRSSGSVSLDLASAPASWDRAPSLCVCSG